jgi:hypothetical protein
MISLSLSTLPIGNPHKECKPMRHPSHLRITRLPSVCLLGVNDDRASVSLASTSL